jgi:hypothetical protein
VAGIEERLAAVMERAEENAERVRKEGEQYVSDLDRFVAENTQLGTENEQLRFVIDKWRRYLDAGSGLQGQLRSELWIDAVIATRAVYKPAISQVAEEQGASDE